MNAIASRDPAALPPEGATRPLAALLGTRTGGVIRLGDPVTVAVRQVDAPRGRVDLDLVGIPE